MDEQKRILTPHNCSVAEAGREQMLDPRHRTGVAAADRRHLDDLTFDELDTVLGSQDPGLAHPVILVEREAPAPERDRHAVLASAIAPCLHVAVNAENWIPPRL